jgi:pyruvate kinase
MLQSGDMPSLRDPFGKLAFYLGTIMRRTKIVCTIGPKSASEEMIEQLILAGMDVARLNFSHGSHEFYRSVVNRIRSVSARLGKSVAILQDLQGPKIRTGVMEGQGIVLTTGQETTITTDVVVGTSRRFSTQYANLGADVAPGEIILLDDGKIKLRCIDVIEKKDIFCVVIHGGFLSSNKGINLPGAALSTPSLTEKDIQDLYFGADVGVDAVALSFVRSPEDVKRLQTELARAKSRPLVIAKIEKPQGVEALEAILDEADGVMVARGDLGVELPLEQVPVIQKRMVDEAIRRGKIVIVATQMLESMISQPTPTRAEVSDVANAVLDGADLVMLSAETAFGDFATQAVEVMDRVIRHTEQSDLARYFRTDVGIETKVRQHIQNALALSAVRASEELDAGAIAVYTSSGATARLVSDYRPKTPIIAYVQSALEQRRLCFTWGVEAFVLDVSVDVERLVRKINDHLMASGRFKTGTKVVLLTKIPLLPSQRTNTIYVHALRSIRHEL